MIKQAIEATLEKNGHTLQDLETALEDMVKHAGWGEFASSLSQLGYGGAAATGFGLGTAAYGIHQNIQDQDGKINEKTLELQRARNMMAKLTAMNQLGDTNAAGH